MAAIKLTDKSGYPDNGYPDLQTLLRPIYLFCQSLPTLQRGLSAIADLLVRYIRPAVRTDDVLQQPSAADLFFSRKCLQQAASKAVVVYDMQVGLSNKVRSKAGE